MRTHELKCWPEYYGPIADGSKPFDLRRNDRHFIVGDKVRIREWDDKKGKLTGCEVTKTISYVLEGVGPGAIPPLQGLARGYCVIGFGTPPRDKMEFATETPPGRLPADVTID